MQFKRFKIFVEVQENSPIKLQSKAFTSKKESNVLEFPSDLQKIDVFDSSN